MPMPKAPVDKNRRPIPPHDDVGLARHALHVEAIAVAMPPQPLPHQFFRLGVAAADVRHHFVALCGGEVVGHGLSISLFTCRCAHSLSPCPRHPYRVSVCFPCPCSFSGFGVVSTPQKYKTSANLGHLFLLRIINAAMTPGTQPQSVSRNTMSIEPQPRSNTAKGGKRMERRTWRQDMSRKFTNPNTKNLYI